MENGKLIIAIDHGNSSIKTKSHEFKVGLVEDVPMKSFVNDQIVYDGTEYYLSTNRLPYKEDKSEDEKFWILTLFAMAKEMVDEGLNAADVIIAAGLPIDHFDKYRDRFRAYLNRGRLRFEYNSVAMEVNIIDVHLFPQSYSAAWAHREDIRLTEKRAIIVDIGGFTTDIIMLDKGLPNPEYIRTLSMGTISLYNKIGVAVNRRFGYRPDEDIVQDYLISNPVDLNKSVMFIIDKQVDEFASVIFNTIRELHFELRGIQSVFVGGGAVLLKKHILLSEYVEKPLLIVDRKANAAGYEFLARAIIADEG